MDLSLEMTQLFWTWFRRKKQKWWRFNIVDLLHPTWEVRNPQVLFQFTSGTEQPGMKRYHANKGVISKKSPGGWTVNLRPQNGKKSRWGNGPRPFPFPQTVQASLGTHGHVLESVAHWVALVFLLLLFLSFFLSPSMWALRRLEYACGREVSVYDSVPTVH